MDIQASSILQLADWKINQTTCKDWMEFNNIEEDRASRVIIQQLRSVLFDIQVFTTDSLEQILHSMGAHPNNNGRGNKELLYGICDEYHIVHIKIIDWLDKISPAIIKPGDPKKLPYGVLDYYGKSGELAIRIARGCKNKKLHITYIDQNPWFDYARFRFKAHKLMYNIGAIEATTANPRPKLNEKFALISTLDLPINVDQDWLDWIGDHIIPYGIVVTSASLPWKLIDKTKKFSFYQYVPN